jgi:hypothetical protein
MAYSKKQEAKIQSVASVIQAIQNHNHKKQRLDYAYLISLINTQINDLKASKANYIQQLQTQLASYPNAHDENDPVTRKKQYLIHQLKTELVLVDALQKMQNEIYTELKLTRQRQDYWINHATNLTKAYQAVHESYLFDLDTNNEILNLLITKNNSTNGH